MPFVYHNKEQWEDACSCYSPMEKLSFVLCKNISQDKVVQDCYYVMYHGQVVDFIKRCLPGLLLDDGMDKG